MSSCVKLSGTLRFFAPGMSPEVLNPRMAAAGERGPSLGGVLRRSRRGHVTEQRHLLGLLLLVSVVRFGSGQPWLGASALARRTALTGALLGWQVAESPAPAEEKRRGPVDPGRDVVRYEDNLKMTELPSGLKYADVRLGKGESPANGTKVTVDYVMMTTGARYGNKIDSTKDRELPYSFVVGDPSIIRGLSEAVSTMRPGGIRRIIIPQSLGFTDDSKQPIPPNFAEFQRFKNIYLNPNRVYQPDLVMDVKLFTFSQN
mmetsp:Transcript_28001/g.63029  ORF Transcript_28001/g.63029 Transcript_28001/m.63029 type:complete len:259 (-) Transcript_28001:38-814(-)